MHIKSLWAVLLNFWGFTCFFITFAYAAHGKKLPFKFEFFYEREFLIRFYAKFYLIYFYSSGILFL